ncbi:MAG: immunoglobulin domain-containing protein [Planctomycetota bacterium]
MRAWKGSCIALMFVAMLTGTARAAQAVGPLVRDSNNPRYFNDGAGHTVFLTGSHVWENLQDRSDEPTFDYTAYLTFLVAHHHNYMRMWGWESAWGAPWTATPPTFAPMPYLRTGPGTANDGQPKFDLSQFNQAYFDRLRARVIAARDQGIYVSIMLFQGWSVEMKPGEPGNPWAGHPFNKNNNINGVDGDTNGDGQGQETQTNTSGTVNDLQKAYVRKVIDTVNDLDNVLYEVSNESNGSYAVAWEYDMVNYIHNYEKTSKAKQHPVGMTACWPNGTFAQVWNSPADYIEPLAAGGYDTSPPDNTGAKVILSDTDHIWGEGGDRTWAWKALCRGLNTAFMDGGAVSFPASTDWMEDCRKAMGATRQLADRIDLAHMPPQDSLSSTGYCIANPSSPNAEYVVYTLSGGNFTVDLTAAGSASSFTAEWIDPSSGATTAAGTVAGGAVQTFSNPTGSDIVLHLKENVATPVPPTLTAQPTDVTVTAGQTATFTVTATGDATLHYQWMHGSTAVGSDASTLTIANAQTADAGSYTVIVTNGAGTATSNPATLTVNSVANQPPVIDSPISATPDPVVNQATCSLLVVAHDPDSGPAALTYTWTVVSGPGTATFNPNGTTAANMTTATFAASGTYALQVAVYDGAASVTDQISLSVTLPSAPVAPTITAQPTDVTVTAGQTATFTVTATGDATLHYQWMHGSTAVGSDASTLTIANAQSAAAGSYTVVVTNGAGSATSNPATLTVNPLPNPIVTVTASLIFSAPSGATAPIVDHVKLTNRSGAPVTVFGTSGTGWLSAGSVIVPAGGSAELTVVVTPANSSVVGAVAYATLTLTNSTGGSQALPAELIVGTPTGLKSRGCAIGDDGGANLSICLLGVIGLLVCAVQRRRPAKRSRTAI